MKSIEENANACQLIEEAAKMLGGVFTIRTFDSKLNRSTSYIVTVPEESDYVDQVAA